jgi:hypothetical protein
MAPDERGGDVMRVMLFLLTVLGGLNLGAGTAVADDGELSMMEILTAEAERPAEEPDAFRSPSLDAVGATLLFSMTGADNANCIRAIPDVTGDGLDEIVVGIEESGQDNIFCLDGASVGTASVVWGFQPYGGLSGGYVYGDQSLVPASDVDGNGYDNLLVATAGGGRTAYSLDTFDGAVRWQFDTYVANNPSSGGWVYSLAEMSDVTGDGVPEVAFGVGFEPDSAFMVDGSAVGAVQAAQVWRYPAGDNINSVRNIGDVNGDGGADVVVSSWENAVIVLDGENGEQIWKTTVGTTNGGDVWTARGIPDVNGDGVNDVIAGSFDLHAYAMSGTDGEVLWSYNTGNRVFSVAPVGDLDGDGGPEVAVGTQDTSSSVVVYVIDGGEGRVFADGFESGDTGAWSAVSP